MTALVTAASCAAALLTAHTAINARLLRQPPSASWGDDALSVLIPARDEVDTIGACLTAVLASRGCDLEVVVCDDSSTDGTASVVRDIAAMDRRVRVVRAPPLPSGWLGKPHACQALAAVATREVLVFLDADVVLEPDALARTARLLRDAALDLVSPYPRQVAVTWTERLVQPLLQWSWLTFLPLRLAERSRAATLCAANGQLLACRREAYDRVGGHRAVAGEVLEDVALARAFTRAGFVATVADGTDLATCRMYGGWQQLRDGYTKSLWAATRTAPGAAAVALMLAWVYVVPPAALLWRVVRRRAGGGTAAAGYLAGVAGRVITARRTGGRPADAAGHPLSVLVLLGLVARSHAARRRGALRWKGRVLP